MDGLSVPAHGFKILAGTANRALADEMARHIGVELCKVTISKFADGEIFVRIDENVRGNDVFIVQPDVGSAKMARGFAKRLNASLAIIDKRRTQPNVAEVMNVVGDVDGMDCVLVDDMIDTAGTVSEASYALKKMGARDVYVCATH